MKPIILRDNTYNTPFIKANTADGEAVFYDRDIPLDYMGIEPEFIKNVYSKSYKLSETGFPDWEASTQTGVIVASVNLPVYAADMAQYEYLLRWRFYADIKYLSGVTTKAIPLIELQEHLQVITKRPYSIANVEAGVFNNNACITAFSIPYLEYMNTSGAKTFTWSTSYGIYSTAVAATFSNITSDSPNVTIKTPSISARCNTSYFATGRKAYIDNNNSTVKLIGDLFRVKKGSNFIRVCYGDLVDMYNE